MVIMMTRHARKNYHEQRSLGSLDTDLELTGAVDASYD
jgi:hypothetical protein